MRGVAWWLLAAPQCNYYWLTLLCRPRASALPTTISCAADVITSLAANAAWLSVFCTVAQFCICCCLIGRGFSVADKSSATRERVRTRTLNRLSPSVTGTRLARARGVRFIASDSGCSGQVHIEKLLLLLLLLLCKSRTQFECFEIKCIQTVRNTHSTQCITE